MRRLFVVFLLFSFPLVFPLVCYDETLDQKSEAANLLYLQRNFKGSKEIYYDILSNEELSQEERSVVLYNLATVLTEEGIYSEAIRTLGLIDDKKIKDPIILRSIAYNRSICYLKMTEVVIDKPYNSIDFLDRIGEAEKYIDKAKSAYDQAEYFNKKIDKKNSYSFDMSSLYADIFQVEKEKNNWLFLFSIATQSKDVLILEFIDYLESLSSTIGSWVYAIDPSNSISLYLKALEQDTRNKFTGFFRGIGFYQEKEDSVFEVLRNEMFKEKDAIVGAFHESSGKDLLEAFSYMKWYLQVYLAYLNQDEVREALRLKYEDEVSGNKRNMDSFIIQLIERKIDGLIDMSSKLSKFKTVQSKEIERLSILNKVFEKLIRYLKKGQKQPNAYDYYNELLKSEIKTDLFVEPRSLQFFLLKLLNDEARNENIDDFKDNLDSLVDSFSVSKEKQGEIQTQLLQIKEDLNTIFGANKKALSLNFKKLLWQKIILSVKAIEWELQRKDSASSDSLMLPLGIQYEDDAIEFCNLYEEDLSLLHTLYQIYDISLEHMVWLRDFVKRQNTDKNIQNSIIASIDGLKELGIQLKREEGTQSLEDVKQHKVFHQLLKEIFSQVAKLQEKKEEASKVNEEDQSKQKAEENMMVPEKPFQLSSNQAIRFVLEMEKDDPSFKAPVYQSQEGVRPW